MRYRKYFTSSKVCSGALVFALLIQFCSLTPRSPVGFARFPIIAAARDDPQTLAGYADLQRVKAIFGQRHVFGIEADQVLRPEFPQDIGKGPIQLGSQAR